MQACTCTFLSGLYGSCIENMGKAVIFLVVESCTCLIWEGGEDAGPVTNAAAPRVSPFAPFI